MRAASGARIHRWRLPLGGDALILGGLLLLFAGLSYGIARQSEPASSVPGTDRRSSYSAEARGWKAFYRLLEKRQNKVMRFQRRPKEWPLRAGVVITGPYSIAGVAAQWSESEAKDALHWVSKGGVLIAFTDADDSLTDALGVRTSETESPAPSAGSGKSARKPEQSDRFRPTSRLTPRPLRARPSGTPLSVRQPASFLHNVGGLKVPGEKRYTAIPAESITLLADKLPLAVAIPVGKGMIIAVSDAGIPDNSTLASADNAGFVNQMVEAHISGKRPTILFDEYHQDYRERNTFWTAIGRPGQIAFWQLAGLFLLMAYSASRRFGLPRPVPAPPRVSSEYVASLADLYRRARATDAALEAVLKIFWRDLCRVSGLPPDAPLPEVAARASAQAESLRDTDRATLAERVIATVSECRAKIEPPETSADGKTLGKTRRPRRKSTLSEAELLRLVSSIEALRKELQIGGSSHV